MAAGIFLWTSGSVASLPSPDQQHREAASNTPSKSHHQLAGTKAYFVGGTVFGSQSFASRDVRKTDAELSLVGNEEAADSCSLFSSTTSTKNAKVTKGNAPLAPDDYFRPA